MCGVLIYKSGHEVYSRVVKNFYTLICRETHANTNFSYMFSSRENVLGKRGARDSFFHHEDTVDVDTSFQQCETRYQTSKQVRGGENNSMSKGRPSLSECGTYAIYVFQINIILFNNLNLTTLASINQNLPKCLYCISK